MTQSRSMSPLEWALLLTLALVWAGSFFFAEIAVEALPPLTVAWVRVSGAAVVLWVVLACLGRVRPLGGEVWRAFLVMGLLNNAIPFSLIFWAQTGITSGLASILNATTPIFTVLVAHAMTSDEQLSANRMAGVILGASGVAILLAEPGMGGSIQHMLAVLGAAVSYGVASVYGRRFGAMGIAPASVAAGQVTGSALLLSPLVLMIDRPWVLPLPGTSVILALSGLVLLSTAFAYFLYFRILATAGATNLSLVTLLIPPGAIIMGAAFLAEPVLLRHLAGMAVIGLGLMAIDGRLWRKLGLP